MRKNKLGRKALALVITFSLSLGCLNGVVFAAEPVVDTIPGTTRTIKEEFDTSLLSVTGYAKGKVNSRKEFIDTEKYVKVSNGDELVAALEEAQKNNVKVIEIVNDIDLGYDCLSAETQASSMISDYLGNGSARSKLTNPAIMESGLSQLALSNINGLTIFSEGGAKVSRAEWKLQGSSKDIIIRNIKFDGMWEWSNGDNKANGWSVMKVNGAKGVWFDHCSFTMGYDGLCDSENGASGLSYTWCTFGEKTTEDQDPDSTLYQTMSYMEYCYNEGLLSEDDEYYQMRKGGATFGQALAFSAFHSKAFLIGSGDKDFKDNEAQGLQDGNQRLEVTLAYSVMSNLGQRVVRMRQGKGHLFNCYIDDMARYQLKQEVPALKSVTDHSLYRCIDVHNGGIVAADTCVFDGVSSAVLGSQIGGAVTAEWVVAFQNAYNQALVVNSRINTQSGETYDGSSWDNDGENPFVAKGYYTDKDVIGKFYWNISIKGIEDLTRDVVPKDENGESYPLEFIYDEDAVLPYEYNVIALDKVQDTVTELSGAFKYNQPADFWLATEYGANEDIQPVKEVVSVESFISNYDSARISKGDMIQLIVARIPSYATDRSLKFESSDPSVAEVLDSGMIIAKDYGTATVTVRADGAVKEIPVEVYQKVTSIALSDKSKTIEEGNTYQLTAEITPENATNKTLIWSSSNEQIATVSEDGVVTGVAAGRAQITCTSEDNPSVRATCNITVKEGSGKTESPLKLGDVNGDNIIDANDALAVLKHAAQLVLLSDSALKAADLDNDGTIDANDALTILKIAAQLI